MDTSNEWGIGQAFTTLANVTGHSDSAKGAMNFLRGEIERLRKLVYVPGLWRCAKCDFRLTRVALSVVTGTASADDTTGEKCPNCQSTLWRVTERDAGNDLAKRCGELQERVTALEAIPTVVESESGNPGWVDAKDAVRMLAELRRERARWMERASRICNLVPRLNEHEGLSPSALSGLQRLARAAAGGVSPP